MPPDHDTISKEKSVELIREMLEKDEHFYIIAVSKDASIVAVHNVDGNILINALALLNKQINDLKKQLMVIIYPDKAKEILNDIDGR